MRSRLPDPNPEKSLVETLEYALTAALMIVVIAALVEIFGARCPWLG